MYLYLKTALKYGKQKLTELKGEIDNNSTATVVDLLLIYSFSPH